jgi:phage terminase small subunit
MILLGNWCEHVRIKWRSRGHERVAPPHTTGAINRAPTSHAINCAKRMMDQVSAMSSLLGCQPMMGKRCIHVLCQKWPFIASQVGARLIILLGNWCEHVRIRWRSLGHERVAHPHPTGAINRAPTSHAINCAKRMMDQVSAMSSLLGCQPMMGKRCIHCIHVLCQKWPFIASLVGVR